MHNYVIVNKHKWPLVGLTFVLTYLPGRPNYFSVRLDRL